MGKFGTWIKDWAWDTVRLIPSFLVLYLAVTSVGFVVSNLAKIQAKVKSLTGKA